MARIVSGIPEQPQFDGGAVLRGFEKGTRARLAEQENQRQNLEAMLQFKQELARTQMLRAKQQELLNQQAQMGDARALSQMAYEAQYGPKTPQEEQMQTMLQTRANITDPKALAMADEAIDSFGKHLKSVAEDKAAMEAIKTGAAEGLIDEEAFMQRYNSGEQRDVLAKDVATAKAERTITNMAKQDAQKAITQAQAILETMPDSPRKLAAQFKLQEMVDSDVMQSKPGAAAAFLQDFQNTLIESDPARRAREKEINARQLEARQPKAYQKMKAAGDEEGMERFVTQRQRFGAIDTPNPTQVPIPRSVEPAGKAERTPAMQAHIGKMKAEKEKRYPGSTSKAGGQRSAPVDTRAATFEAMGAATSDADLIRLLKERGVRLTPSTIQEIRSAADEWRNSVASGAGADR